MVLVPVYSTGSHMVTSVKYLYYVTQHRYCNLYYITLYHYCISAINLHLLHQYTSKYNVSTAAVQWKYYSSTMEVLQQYNTLFSLNLHTTVLTAIYPVLLQPAAPATNFPVPPPSCTATACCCPLPTTQCPRILNTATACYHRCHKPALSSSC